MMGTETLSIELREKTGEQVTSVINNLIYVRRLDFTRLVSDRFF